MPRRECGTELVKVKREKEEGVTLRGVITARNKLGWDIFESIFAIVERVFVVMRFVSEKRRKIMI